jgi:hypothetical protein
MKFKQVSRKLLKIPEVSEKFQEFLNIPEISEIF